MAVSPEQLQLLIIHLVRDIDTVQAAEPRLDETLFDRQSEIVESACWRASRSFYRRTGELIPQERFGPALRSVLKERFPDHDMPDGVVADTMREIFTVDPAALEHRLIRPVLEEFILTRSVEPHVNKLVHGRADYADVITDMSKAAEAARISAAKPENLRALGLDVFADAGRIPTGCRPIDEVFGGGICVGETVGLLGPMKGGKTSLCQSLACEFVKKDAKHRVTYVTYEESGRQQWRKLLISYMDKHHRREVEGKRPHEIADDIKVDLRAAHERLAAQLNLIDMSGAMDGQGYGGPPELATCLEGLYRDGRLGQLVIIDHVLPLVRQYMAMQGLDQSKQMRHKIQEVAIMAKGLAPRLKVCMVLAHQTDAKGNRRGIHKPTHTNSAENKLFAEYLHDCLCLGAKQSDDEPIAWLNLSASRNRETRAVLVRIAGERCRVELVQDYVADEGTGQFIHAEDLMHGHVAPEEVTGRMPRRDGPPWLNEPGYPRIAGD